MAEYAKNGCKIWGRRVILFWNYPGPENLTSQFIFLIFFFFFSVLFSFGFLPQTYILPYDLRLLRKVWSRNTQNVPWIVKPVLHILRSSKWLLVMIVWFQPASARGTGIQVIHQWNQLPRKRPLVVQSYLENPYLINDTKFDIRLYVFVTSVNPLRIYMYENGLVRFASCEYF